MIENHSEFAQRDASENERLVVAIGAEVGEFGKMGLTSPQCRFRCTGEKVAALVDDEDRKVKCQIEIGHLSKIMPGGLLFSLSCMHVGEGGEGGGRWIYATSGLVLRKNMNSLAAHLTSVMNFFPKVHRHASFLLQPPRFAR
jgi:hypothetical protein